MPGISEISICRIFALFWPPKVKSTRSNQPMEHHGYVVVIMIGNSMLQYKLKEDELKPNGKLFEEKLYLPEEQKVYQN